MPRQTIPTSWVACRSPCSSMQQQQQRARVWCLMLLTLLGLVKAAGQSLEDDFISLPADFAARVPARLVFSAAELVSCINDLTAKRCVLKGDIKLQEDTWRPAFQDTGGAALVHAEVVNFTITSEPCTPGGECLPGSSDVLHTLDMGRLAYAFYVQPDAVLRMSNVQLFDLAPGSAFRVGNSATPWMSTGQGVTTWPSIGLAPNATFVLVNSSILYYNPSDPNGPERDDCATYTQKRIFAFRQVWGEGNISQINSTANLIIGPQVIDVTIRNASTDAIVGNATVVYRNVSFVCLGNTTASAQPGLSAGALAAAIAVPVGVALLAGGLLAAYCLRRRRRRMHRQQQQQQQQQQQKQGLLEPRAVAPAGAAAARDLEVGPDSGAGRVALLVREGDQAKLSREQKGDSFSSRREMGEPTAGRLTTTPSKDLPTALNYEGAVALLPAGTRANSAALQGSGGAVLQLPDRAGAQSFGGMHDSGGAGDVSACSTGLASQLFATGATQSSRTAGGMDDRLSSVSALLKARSDVAVLRDLKIGPLLGRGSYGRVYKGRWKATPVAVKIIEHHAAGAQSSGCRAISAGRETLLATSVSHPNVVTTYHISTMSMSERSALASSWLEGGGGPSSSQQAMQELDDRRADEDSGSRRSSMSSDVDESPPDMLETWVIMEFCEKGSLERAVRLGKFQKAEGSGQLVGICKALLDTASGLDYLHSIGVVHGDLKTANVLLKGSTRDARGVACKITDFGLSRVLDPEATHISTGTYGTIVYMPKELLLSGRMTQATDIYSFGLIMWELFCGRQVMDEGLSIGQMFYQIAYENWRPEIPAGCPRGFAELMTACWHEDPEQRPTAQQLLRSLQKLYVQAKQQFLSDTGSQPAARAKSRAGRSAAAAGGAPASPSTAAASPFPSGGLPEVRRVSSSRATAGAAADESASSDNNVVAGAHTDAQHAAQWKQQPFQHSSSLQRSVGIDASSRLPSSVEEGGSSSIDMSAVQPRIRRSQGSREDDTGEYQPYVTAVLQRSTSVSSLVLGRPHSPMHASFTSAVAGPGSHPVAMVQDPAALARLQEQLAQEADPAAQQQLLQSYAVFVPPMLPIDVSGSMAVSPRYTQQGSGLQEEENLFDEDGLASESLLRQLTNPSNAFGGAGEYEDQVSGYLYSAGGVADSDQQAAAAVSSMQQAVEQYRQQLQLLQQQSQRQSQQPL